MQTDKEDVVSPVGMIKPGHRRMKTAINQQVPNLVKKLYDMQTELQMIDDMKRKEQEEKDKQKKEEELNIF